MKERDWNEEYQRLFSLPEETADEKLKKYCSIDQLSAEFELIAVDIGMTIIDEFSLSASEKTIKPLDIGGVAGGEKYLTNNIFFKVFLLNLFPTFSPLL